MTGLNGFLRVSKSSIHGWGLFAKHDLTPGQALFQVAGRLRSEAYDSRYKVGSNWYSVAPRLWIDPKKNDPASFLNHSCSPNCIWDDQRWIVAKDHISTGEEILIDYSTTELDPFWRMKCRCGDQGCRRLVRPAFLEGIEIRRELKRISPKFITSHWTVGADM